MFDSCFDKHLNKDSHFDDFFRNYNECSLLDHLNSVDLDDPFGLYQPENEYPDNQNNAFYFKSNMPYENKDYKNLNVCDKCSSGFLNNFNEEHRCHCGEDKMVDTQIVKCIHNEVPEFCSQCVTTKECTNPGIVDQVNNAREDEESYQTLEKVEEKNTSNHIQVSPQNNDTENPATEDTPRKKVKSANKPAKDKNSRSKKSKQSQKGTESLKRWRKEDDKELHKRLLKLQKENKLSIEEDLLAGCEEFEYM